MNNNESQTRLISSQAYGVRPYEDNCPDMMALCKDTERTPGEVLRDLVDEALRARRNPQASPDGIVLMLNQLLEQNRAMAERQEQTIKQYEHLLDRNTREKASLKVNMREFYGLLLETLSSSIMARRLAWNYVARTVLLQLNYSDEKIKERYEAEMRATLDERDLIADEMERTIKNREPDGNRQSGDSQASSAGAVTPTV